MTSTLLPPSEAERLAALRSYDILDTGFEAGVDDLTSLAAGLTSSPLAMVTLVDADRLWFRSRIGFEENAMPREIAFCPHAILEPSRTFFVNDATADPRFADNPLVTGSACIRFSRVCRW